MTQRGIAEAMTARGHSMGQSTIAKIEKAQRPVRLNEAVALAAVLRVGLDDLVTDPVRRGQRDALATARAAEREAAAEAALAEHRLYDLRADLAAAQQAVSDATARLESALTRRDAARAEAEALAAAEGE